VYWLLTENYVLNANILVFMLIHTELFSNVSGLGLTHCGLGFEKIFVPRPRPRSHSFWPRAQLASLTSLPTTWNALPDHIRTVVEQILPGSENCSEHTV